MLGSPMRSAPLAFCHARCHEYEQRNPPHGESSLPATRVLVLRCGVRRRADGCCVLVDPYRRRPGAVQYAPLGMRSGTDVLADGVRLPVGAGVVRRDELRRAVQLRECDRRNAAIPAVPQLGGECDVRRSPSVHRGDGADRRLPAVLRPDGSRARMRVGCAVPRVPRRCGAGCTQRSRLRDEYAGRRSLRCVARGRGRSVPRRCRGRQPAASVRHPAPHPEGEVVEEHPFLVG